jgi:hypothetical protein
MNINSRLEKLERVTAGETDFTMLELGQGWSVEIPAKVAPQVFRNIKKIYWHSDGSGESMAD